MEVNDKMYNQKSDYKNLCEENIDESVKKIIETKNAKCIYIFTMRCKNLTKEDIDKLTEAIIDTKDPVYIGCFAEKVKGLSKENIDALTKGIIETKSAQNICYFARDVKNLSKENKDALAKGIVETKVISCIAKTLYYTESFELIDKIFGSLTEYITFCESMKESISIYTDDEFKHYMQELRLAYFDYNINKYLQDDLQDEKGNRKVLKWMSFFVNLKF